MIRKFDSIDLVAFALLGAGIALFAWGLLLQPPISPGAALVEHYGDWTPGLVVDALLLLVLNRIIRQQERHRVLSQAGSLSNEFALDAVRRCREEGWLQNGAMAGRGYVKARLAGADLNGAVLIGADLSFADLSQCDLTHADLRQVCLKGANLTGADLRWADLSGATLQWADLRGAHLDGTNVTAIKGAFAAIDPEHAARPEFAAAIVGGFLTDRQQHLVRSSFELVLEKGEPAIVCFYGHLFAAAPELRSLFSGDLQRQAGKFLQSLKMIVGSLARTERNVPVLQRLGERHRGYGVAPHHYQIAGSTLIATLAEVLAEDFTGEVEEAWQAAYQLIASIMGGSAVTLEARPVPCSPVTALDPAAAARAAPALRPPAWRHAHACHRGGT
jgi:hemoglobin-like flavoprotein